jgi:hypothetical protein
MPKRLVSSNPGSPTSRFCLGYVPSSQNRGAIFGLLQRGTTVARDTCVGSSSTQCLHTVLFVVRDGTWRIIRLPHAQITVSGVLQRHSSGIERLSRRSDTYRNNAEREGRYKKRYTKQGRARRRSIHLGPDSRDVWQSYLITARHRLVVIV